jgi:hypothetical protein
MMQVLKGSAPNERKNLNKYRLNQGCAMGFPRILILGVLLFPVACNRERSQPDPGPKEVADPLKALGAHVERDPGGAVVRVSVKGDMISNALLKELKECKQLREFVIGDSESWLGDDTELGDSWRPDETRREPGNVPAELGKIPVTDAWLEELKDLRELRTLVLNNTQVTDAGLKELKELSQLQTLGLSKTKVTDAGLKQLKELSQLQTLALDNTQVRDAGLKYLRGLDKLGVLWLSNTGVTDAGLKELKDLKLEGLHLNGTQVTGTGFKDLKGLDKLWNVHLKNTKVTGPGIGELGQLERLSILILGGRNLTDADLIEIKKLRQLSSLELSLNDSHITDAGLKELKDRQDLQALCLDRTQVTAVGLKELQGLKHLFALRVCPIRGLKQFYDNETLDCPLSGRGG